MYQSLKNKKESSNIHIGVSPNKANKEVEKIGNMNVDSISNK